MHRRSASQVIKPVLDVTPAVDLIDRPLHINVRGMTPHEPVTLRAHVLDSRGTRWGSHAVFIADGRGVVDVATMAPLSGSYSGVDAGGLIASLVVEGLPDRPYQSTGLAPLGIEFETLVADRCVAVATAQRLYVQPDLDVRTVNERYASGLLFRPRTAEPLPGVIVVGGSSGGLSFSAQVAALLASHGFATLALAYFGTEGLPDHLVDIPLEYFEGAIEWFCRQPGVRQDALGFVGRSRGAELALLLGSRLPVIRAVVAYCPSHAVWNGLRGDRIMDGSAWTISGQPVPFLSLARPFLAGLRRSVFSNMPISLAPLFETALSEPYPDEALIPVEHTNGPILLISGDDDRMWPATQMGEAIMRRLAAHRHPFESRHYHYAGAGHLMRPPGVPTSVLRGVFAFGGLGPSQAAANRAAWSETLSFLKTNLNVQPAAAAAAAIGE